MIKKVLNFVRSYALCHCEERSDAAISCLKTNGIASPSARNDNLNGFISRKLSIIISAILGFTVVFSGFYIKEHQIDVKAVMKSYHLLPEPETLTELYFEDHLNLPKKLTLNAPYSFRFTIHNLEYRNMVYSYQISAISQTVVSDQLSVISTDYRLPITDNRLPTTENRPASPAGGQLISKGKVELKHDEYATIPVEFSLKKKAERVKIEVNLADQNQPIHFWLEGNSNQWSVVSSQQTVVSSQNLVLSTDNRLPTTENR